jgi:predicted ATP-grasp superfamily ATP-dependent carboligase
MVKVFVYEYGSGGGLINRPSHNPLMYQGELMLRALISDLAALPGIDIITMRDPQLPLLELPAPVFIVTSDAHADDCFNDCLLTADAVWPIAPECAGILERLSLKIVGSNRILLGSSPDAVRIASSQMLTAQTLSRAGIPISDTYLPSDVLPDGVDAWVAKSDHGAGFSATQIFHGAEHALVWIEESGEENYVLQPFIHGSPCGLSLLCCGGVAHVLSCDEQRIAVRNNRFHYLGTRVNRISHAAVECRGLARAIAAAIPGLWGFVGVDFIMTKAGPVVLGICPRITASYAGLHASIGRNPAGLVLELLETKLGLDPPLFEKIVVNVDADPKPGTG